jgi:hypothetical protein
MRSLRFSRTRPVVWLWQDPLLDPTRALLEIDREVYVAYLKKRRSQVRRKRKAMPSAAPRLLGRAEV